MEDIMRNKLIAGAAVLALALSSLAVTSPAQARWHGGWHHGWGGGAALGGFAAGAIIGGALASGPYYGSGYYYGPRYYNDYAYSPGGNEEAYCAQRFHSYDPASGTYLGYDGARHPCP
jgi:hypothetical protein